MISCSCSNMRCLWVWYPSLRQSLYSSRILWLPLLSTLYLTSWFSPFSVPRSPLEMALGSAHFGGYSGPVTPGKVVYTPAADGSECGRFPKCQSWKYLHRKSCQMCQRISLHVNISITPFQSHQVHSTNIRFFQRIKLRELASAVMVLCAEAHQWLRSRQKHLGSSTTGW